MKVEDALMRLKVFAQDGCAPEAIAVNRTIAEIPTGVLWMLHRFGPEMRRDDALGARWGCVVVCTAEFAAWWLARPAGERPEASFFMEVWGA